MTPELRNRLEQLAADYSRSEVDWERSLASRFGAVPLHADIGGCILLAPNGDWLFVHSDQDWTSTIEYSRDVSDEDKAVALRTAAEKHPELLVLLKK